MARIGVTTKVVAGVLALMAAAGCKKPPPPIPPPTVLVAPAVQQDLSRSSEFVGSIDGYVNAEIRAREKGVLKTQDYQDGAFVKTGQLLFTIDPSEYQAAVAKAKGALARAQAAYGQAKVTADRYRPLAAKQAVSQQDLDDAVASQRAASASVDSAKASLDEAQLDLGYCRITSPVDGVAGSAKVRVGNLVGQGEPTLLTTVSQLNPMRVTFPISESQY
jgi:membrane fusion protein (multidrug efflux system)